MIIRKSHLDRRFSRPHKNALCPAKSGHKWLTCWINESAFSLTNSAVNTALPASAAERRAAAVNQYFQPTQHLAANLLHAPDAVK